MKELILRGQNKCSKILIGESIENYHKYTSKKRVVFITDKNIFSLYNSFFQNKEVVIIDVGENSKTLKSVNSIYNRLLKLEVDRSTFVLGVGGGIVCDIAGFVASTFMRGLPFGFVSTTLLSQVDASIGGKNGVNFKGYKNIIGVFNQPDFVICETTMLKTLPQRELANGFSEIIKASLIADSKLFTFLNNNHEKALTLNRKTIEHLIYSSLKIKLKIVEKDEREKNERKKLNFGHTIGHALEKITSIPHGNAVSIGINYATHFSYLKKNISMQSKVKVEKLLIKYNLPTSIDVNKKLIKKAIKKDKKRDGEYIDFVFLKAIGCCEVNRIRYKELEDLIDDMSKYC